MNKLINVIILTSLTTLLMSCTDSEKNKLDNRVIDFWAHKINKDFEKAYEFLSPGWRSNEGKTSYILRMSQSRVDWLNVELKEKKCSEKFLCEVLIEIEYEYQMKGSTAAKIKVPTTLHEKWLMKDNIWYFVPVRVNL